MESTHSCCLAVRCISELLLQTTLYPVPGNPSASAYLHRPRHRDLPFLGSRWECRVYRNIEPLSKQHSTWGLHRCDLSHTVTVPKRHNKNCVLLRWCRCAWFYSEFSFIPHSIFHSFFWSHAMITRNCSCTTSNRRKVSPVWKKTLFKEISLIERDPLLRFPGNWKLWNRRTVCSIRFSCDKN